MTTNEYLRGIEAQRWPPFVNRLWQRGYYDRIVRNESELARIREYIATNPQRWAEDRENPAVPSVAGPQHPLSDDIDPLLTGDQRQP